MNPRVGRSGIYLSAEKIMCIKNLAAVSLKNYKHDYSLIILVPSWKQELLLVQ